MKPSLEHTSLEELQAGHALADLSVQELEMWRDLANAEGVAEDAQLEWIALQLEIDAALLEPELIPESLVAMLNTQAREFAAPPAVADVVGPKSPRASRHNPWWGWAVAAGLAVLLVVQSKKSDSKNTIPLELAKTVFIQETPDLLRLPFAGTTGDHAGTQGEVLWSDQKQQGYLVLAGLPVNDSQRSQYQLWIVDPKRDEFPVDGGVFDVTTQGQSVVIEINAKLTITDPKAFVITVEQVGGVVRSKQEKVAGVAKK
jgi:Anti-sigma-K factor rskA